MQIYNLVDSDELSDLMTNGYLREQFHPTEPLAIFNYTDRAQTRPEIFREYPALNHCRGLIWNTANGEVVARPFKKFWNRGQDNAARIRPTDRVEVSDKMDGSLGIVYRRPSDGFYAVATRGSFTSDQALHATELLGDKYADWFPAPGETALMEIVFPANRIVLDYGDQDDLIMLGSVEIDSGATIGPVEASDLHRWSGPVAPLIVGGKWQDVMKVLPLNRENKEGVVVRSVMPGSTYGNMIKLKQEDYLILHRAIFGLSTRRVYEGILAGTLLEKILEPLPDEFHDWTTAVYLELFAAYNKREIDLNDQYLNTMSYAFHSGITGVDEENGGLGGYYVDHDNRGALAKLFQESDDAWALFALLDGKDIGPRIWKDLQPPAHQTPSVYTPNEGN